MITKEAAVAEQNHFLYPGMVFAKSEDFVISTILGSCIAVCLWDRFLRVGGMNHYLLPLWNGEGLQTPKFGNVSIPALIDKMLLLGCTRGNLSAKVFGGSNVLETSSSFLRVGERNIHLAETALKEAKITIACQDVGGTQGRKILFRTSSGEVFVKKLRENSQSAAK